MPVYGSIHSLLYSNPHETSDISGFEYCVVIIYVLSVFTLNMQISSFTMTPAIFANLQPIQNVVDLLRQLKKLQK